VPPELKDSTVLKTALLTYGALELKLFPDLQILFNALLVPFATAQLGRFVPRQDPAMEWDNLGLKV